MLDRYVELLLFVTLIATISLAFFTNKKKKNPYINYLECYLFCYQFTYLH